MAEAKHNNHAGKPPMGPGGKGMKGPGGKPRNTKEAVGRIFGYIRNDVPMLVIVLICVLINTICSLAGSYLLRPIINDLGTNAADYLSAATPALAEEVFKTGVESLLQGLLLMVCVYMFSVVCSYLQSRIMVTISQRAIRNMRNDLFGKMQKLPIRYFDTNNHGDYLLRS